MALHDAQFGALFELQSAPGVIAPGLLGFAQSPPASVNAVNGTVFGDANSGVGGSGLDLTVNRVADEAATVTGSLTRKFDSFIRAGIATFSYSFPIAGNKAITTGTPVDSEFLLDPGVDAIYQACGLTPIVPGPAAGTQYDCAGTVPITGLVYDSGVQYLLFDMQGSIALAFNVGGIGIATATFTGKVDLNETVLATFPATFLYGDQDQVASPVVESVGNQFGPTRGFSELTVTVDNAINETEDSNAVDGLRIEQESRNVNVAMTIDSDDSTPDFDFNNLVTTISRTDSMFFQVGTVNAGTEPAVSYKPTLTNMNIQDLTPAQPSKSKANTLTAVCTATTSGDEFKILFN